MAKVKNPQANDTLGINMLLEKETKGALRYAEVDERGSKLEIGSGAKIGALYIRKDAFESAAPKAISVTVNW